MLDMIDDTIVSIHMMTYVFLAKSGNQESFKMQKYSIVLRNSSIPMSF